MKKLIRYFMNGLLFLAPVGLTLYVLVSAFQFLDGLLGKYLPVGLKIPGLGLVMTLVLVVLFGLLTTSLLTRRFFSYIERLFNRLPIVKLIYCTIKDVIDAFIGDKKTFDRPVMVTVVPNSDIKALGFITQETMAHLDLADHVAVYFPQSYNIAGSVLLVPKKNITLLDYDSAQLMTFIVSAGITGKNQARCEIR